MVSVEAPGTWHTLHWPGPSQGPASGLASAWRCLARRRHCNTAGGNTTDTEDTSPPKQMSLSLLKLKETLRKSYNIINE